METRVECLLHSHQPLTFTGKCHSRKRKKQEAGKPFALSDDEEHGDAWTRLRERRSKEGAMREVTGKVEANGSTLAGVSFGFERRYIIHRACTIVGSFINTNGVW